MNDPILGAGAIEWQGTRYKTLLAEADTNGTIAVVDSVSPPNSGPPRHIHHDADETFVLLTGEVEFWLEGERFIKSPGTAVFVPRGKEHTFRVVSAVPSRHVVVLTPGGFEGFFEDMARDRLKIPEDMAAIEESAARYRLSFTGPPLAAQ